MRELAESAPLLTRGSESTLPYVNVEAVPCDKGVAAALPEESGARRRTPYDFESAYRHLETEGWLDLPLVHPRVSLRATAAAALKRLADVVISAVLLLVLLPFMAVVAVLICVESRGPALFSQERVGKCGRTFRIRKFRTMVADAHHHEARIVAECGGDPRFVKIDCDPRVTRLGTVLRRTSIDELPQLWNVLRGDMSLVGPRPSQPKEVAHYKPDQFARLLVKPGVTGMWQISGRSALSFEHAVALDKRYVQEWTPLLDAKILVKTVAVVLRCSGAC